jgi:hypothetical protein
MEHIKTPGDKKPPDACSQLWIGGRHRVWPDRVAEQSRHILRSGMHPVNWDRAIQGRPHIAVHGDRGHFNAVAAFRKRVRQVSDVYLLPTDDGRVELGHHQNAHTST